MNIDLIGPVDLKVSVDEPWVRWDNSFEFDSFLGDQLRNRKGWYQFDGAYTLFQFYWVYKPKNLTFPCPSSGGHILKLERYRED